MTDACRHRDLSGGRNSAILRLMFSGDDSVGHFLDILAGIVKTWDLNEFPGRCRSAVRPNPGVLSYNV